MGDYPTFSHHSATYNFTSTHCQ